MKKKYFGTDGIRGRVGTAPISPDFMLQLGWACGRVFADQWQGKPTVIIGKDTRVSGYMFESALEAGLVAAGADVRLLGPMPTPAVALLTRSQNAAAGIVISASHNPFYDNGIKFFCDKGAKLSDETELAIEAALEMPLETVDSRKLGKASRVVDAAGRYIEFCKSTLPEDVSLRGLKIVLDCANGATYHIAPAVFAELGAEITVIGASPDGYNINHEFGSTAPDALIAAVIEAGADLGIAFDGDGDRVLFVDADGSVVDGDELLYVLATHRVMTGRSDSGVVGTLMSNMGLELALQEHGLKLARANVGDRYVREIMNAQGWHLGGESSGHIICSDVTTTGDGIVSALQVLAAIVMTEMSLGELRGGMCKMPQVLVNVPVTNGAQLRDHPQVQAATAAAEKSLEGRGRVLLRPSGTEPVIRVMVEGEDQDTIHQLAHSMADTIADLT
ncbi:phosphoglucosamine mutase [Luminiphilus syltensis NOR5-1B]|uniref:Phosphoglucosamine mutase n=1 Tax=Luminiphilus syltensis NOR5-1B TaxID=565045 RepID=B8KS05_9GAMM|nr:phosphoglucosamine mutase [Luminiphilus syltensis]EED36273.1 phosphoglucosamine mutase [Luminiphilus syltensis NOR5-1B]